MRETLFVKIRLVMLKRFFAVLVLFRLFILFSGTSALSGCANVLPPEGGDRDSIPPSVIKEASTPNFQTNFEKQVIELTFDEWVVLEDAFNQVIVSPPLQKREELKLKKRTVRLTFDEEEELREDATYTINFGEAIKDLNEKNPTENLRFVFSTGDVLDSLSVKAKAYDVLTNEPVEDVWFMLYENRADSVIRTERPYYVAKTDEDGRCSIENVRADTFKIAAVKSAGPDYLYDQPNEQIAFLDTNYLVSMANSDTIYMPLFIENKPLQLTGSEVGEFGIAKLIFNREPDTVNISHSAPDLDFIKEIDKDTLKLWYGQEQSSPWRILINWDTTRIDTIYVEALPRDEFVQAKALTCDQHNKRARISPVEPVKLLFNHPLYSWDTTMIKIYEDTLQTVVQPQIFIDTLNARQLIFQYAWKEGVPYEFRLLPGAITDIFTLQSDSVNIDYEAQLLKDFGNINLTVEDLDTTQNYIIQLLGSGDKVEKEFFLSGVSRFNRRLETLAPASYKIKIVEDRNANQKWDTGNYDMKFQPEQLMIEKLEQLRANWDLEFATNWRPRR